MCTTKTIHNKSLTNAFQTFQSVFGFSSACAHANTAIIRENDDDDARYIYRVRLFGDVLYGCRHTLQLYANESQNICCALLLLAWNGGLTHSDVVIVVHFFVAAFAALFFSFIQYYLLFLTQNIDCLCAVLSALYSSYSIYPSIHSISFCYWECERANACACAQTHMATSQFTHINCKSMHSWRRYTMV